MGTIGLIWYVLCADSTKYPFESATDIEAVIIHEISMDESGTKGIAAMSGLDINQYARKGRLEVPLRAREVVSTTG